MTEVSVLGALVAGTKFKALSPVPQRGLWHRIVEPFTGAWQRNISEDHGTLLAYPTLYACIMRIATDIGKLPFTLQEQDENGIWEARDNPAYGPVLRKPNHYQTAQQFRESWLLSKLIQGNTYALKRRDARGVVTALYILDPSRVLPMVSDSGQVFYKLSHDKLNTVQDGLSELELIVPAREIIHDRCVTLHHWLIGIPPLSAAYWPTIKNLRILKSATEFFGNNAQPGGILTAPAGMSEDDAKLVQAYWQDNYTGENAGRIAVIGADMKFTSFAMKGADSQLVEQMKYSDEQICAPFGIKPYKVGIGSPPGGWKSDDVNVEYYGDALSQHIEAMENLLDEGLKIERPLGIVVDTDPLWRMDEGKQADVQTKLVSGKIKTPDEGRAMFGLSPTAGGSTLWGQHQDYPLGVLATRNDLNAPPPPTPPKPDEPPPDEDQTDKLIAALWQKLPESIANAS
jgi:HK97 family phage portal protein